jgi:hypothetical protein
MSVYHNCVPPGCFPSNSVRVHVVLQSSGTGLPKAVHVNDGTEIIQRLISREFCGFPHRTLSRFSIPE